MYLLQGHEVCGKISLKHIYEIALLKQEDPANKIVSLQNICKNLIYQCHKMGIEITQKPLSPEEYAIFLQERMDFLEAKRKALEEKRLAKMSRI